MCAYKKPPKWILFFKEWVFPIITFIFTLFIAPLLYEYFVTIRPEIKSIKQKISDIDCSVQDIDERYTRKDINGVDCNIGISSEMSGNSIAVPENNKFGLKGADVIYIINPYSPYGPAMKFTVYLKKADNKISSCDFFISKDAIEKLDIKKKEFFKGIFPMKIQLCSTKE